MREVFQRHLRPVGGKAYQVRDCRITYMRREEASRSLHHYILRLAEPGTGREWSQLVTGLRYGPDQTRRVWEELRRSDPEPAISDASPALAPFSYVPDLDMLVQVFPYDHQLPALLLLTSGPSPALERLLLARFGPGDWRTEAWDVESVRYLVGMRATLRLTTRARDTATGRVEERRFYAKVYREEEEGEQIYRMLRELEEKVDAGGAGLTVGRPIVYLSGLRTLLQEEVSGARLLDILRREEEAIPAARKAARAVAALHLLDVVPPRRRHLRNEVALLQRTSELLRSACPRLGPEIEETIGAVVTGLEEVPPAPTHGDLRPGHILLDGDRVALLDFDKFAGADPVLDVANLLFLLARAGTRSPRLRDRRRAIAQAFAEEYFAHVPEAWRARLPLHYAGAVLKKTAVLWRQQAPDWLEETEALIREARDSLAGRIW